MSFEILNYEVIRKIGEGGMGQVFLARNKSIHQFVAIKMLHPQLSADPTLRDRFRQEAIMLSSLDHPNIVKFLNYVENDQGVFLIMEYVDGMTLEDFILKKNGLIVEDRAYPMMIQILDAFAYAHMRGIVHRDIKPGNIFISKEGNIKVLDFGIAQILSDANEQRESGRGSVAYMSPEQVHGQKADVRTDIYSLGVVFYQMLTGRMPYDINSLTVLEIKKRIANDPLPRMKDAYPYISDYLQVIVDKATKKTPDARFAGCIEFKKALVRARNEAADQSGAGEDNSEHAGGNGSASGRKGNKGLWITVLTAIAVIAVGVFGYWTYDRNRVKRFEWYTDHDGIAKGLVSARNQGVHYELDYSSGRLRHLLLVDENGSACAGIDSVYDVYRPVEVEYFYDNDGKLSYKKVYDHNGKSLYKATFSQDMKKVHIDRESVDSLSADIKDYSLEYDAEGRVSKVVYIDENGSKTQNSDKVSSESYTYDNQGRIIRVTFNDVDNRPVAKSDGVSMISFEYGGPGVVVTKYYDTKGTVVIPSASPVDSKKSKSPAVLKKGKSVQKSKTNAVDSVGTPGKTDRQGRSKREISASENIKKVLKDVR